MENNINLKNHSILTQIPKRLSQHYVVLSILMTKNCTLFHKPVRSMQTVMMRLTMLLMLKSTRRNLKLSVKKRVLVG